MSGSSVNPWLGLLPKPKKISGFDIPEKSSVLEGNRRHFSGKLVKRPNNMNPIMLQGSSKYPAPQMMKGTK